MNDDGWVVIPNWKRFQHYTDRDPLWIKDYVSQLNDDDWRTLTMYERGCLQTLRLLYASADGKLPLRRALASMSSRGRSGRAALESLNRAGFVEVRASKPLALARSREKRREDKEDSASTTPRKPRPADAPRDGRRASNSEPARVAVDEEMLRLARGWLAAHESGRDPAWAPTEDEPF